MELLLASAVGLLTAVGVFLMTSRRSFPLVLGLTFLSHAVNLLLFAVGRLSVGAAPILRPEQGVYTDPVPQALVLTAIVISFGMTALLVVLALRAFLETGSDALDHGEAAERGQPGQQAP